jgi:hypothetical protein
MNYSEQAHSDLVDKWVQRDLLELNLKDPRWQSQEIRNKNSFTKFTNGTT